MSGVGGMEDRMNKNKEHNENKEHEMEVGVRVDCGL